jgi:hypothetical protein
MDDKFRKFVELFANYPTVQDRLSLLEKNGTENGKSRSLLCINPSGSILTVSQQVVPRTNNALGQSPTEGIAHLTLAKTDAAYQDPLVVHIPDETDRLMSSTSSPVRRNSVNLDEHAETLSRLF